MGASHCILIWHILCICFQILETGVFATEEEFERPYNEEPGFHEKENGSTMYKDFDSIRDPWTGVSACKSRHGNGGYL